MKPSAASDWKHLAEKYLKRIDALENEIGKLRHHILALEEENEALRLSYTALVKKREDA